MVQKEGKEEWVSGLLSLPPLDTCFLAFLTTAVV